MTHAQLTNALQLEAPNGLSSQVSLGSLLEVAGETEAGRTWLQELYRDRGYLRLIDEVDVCLGHANCQWEEA